MAGLRRSFALALSVLPPLLLAAAMAVAMAATAVAQPPAAAPGLYDRPVLAIDPGLHTARINGVDADAEGRWAATGSYDKTVRIWSLADGALLHTIRLPAGPGDVGKAFAVAVSPDGVLVAAAGWTRGTAADRQEQIYT